MADLEIPRMAILASGSGTTAEAYATAIHRGDVDHEIGLVIASRADAGILERVQRWNYEYGFHIANMVINGETHPGDPNDRGQTTEESMAIRDAVENAGCDMIVLLGYMVVVNDPLISTYGYLPGQHRSPYQARMLNTHPAPLPLTADTYGVGASERVMKAYRKREVSVSKHTVHVVAQGVDKGPIVAEHEVPIKPSDTAKRLFKRLQKVEKAHIAGDIDDFWRGRQEWLANA